MATKPIKTLELCYPMSQFLMIINNYTMGMGMIIIVHGGVEKDLGL